MKVLTDPQISEIESYLIQIEGSCNLQIIIYSEKIRDIIRKAESVTLHLKR